MPRIRNDYQRVTLTLSEPRLKLYVIAAEGDKTEYLYFTALKKRYQEQFRLTNLHVEFLERPKEESERSDPKHVEQMIATFLAHNQEYGLHEAYDEIWFILDTDEYEHRQTTILQLVRKCQENRMFNLGLSNPSFIDCLNTLSTIFKPMITSETHPPMLLGSWFPHSAWTSDAQAEWRKVCSNNLNGLPHILAAIAWPVALQRY